MTNNKEPIATPIELALAALIVATLIYRAWPG